MFALQKFAPVVADNQPLSRLKQLNLQLLLAESVWIESNKNLVVALI